MVDETNKVLILGSAPCAMAAQRWDRAPFTHIVAINNAWRIRSDWDFLIHPEDFPHAKRPDSPNPGQKIVTAEEYVPRQNEYGGFVYAGGTMAFTAGYWALSALKPSVLAYFGCDMVYSGSGRTHFYGTGQPDPLRADITLRSLEAKSARLGLFAALQGCRAVRLSTGESRLVFPSVKHDDPATCPLHETSGMAEALRVEAELGYSVPSGRYWEVERRFDPNRIDALDRLWLTTYKNAGLEQVA
ncbi:MAG: hypothetical protein AAF625_11955 [Pseudomonadota bacterium]